MFAGLSEFQHGGSFYRGALLRLFAASWCVALLRVDLDWLRNRAGGTPNSRLKARLKEGSDS